MDDTLYMRRAFELARQAHGRTWPNPMVGCVLVKDGRVIGEGFHAQAGRAHAELDAITRAVEPVAGATAYVNLEPCCHTAKRTPPCAQRLIAEVLPDLPECFGARHVSGIAALGIPTFRITNGPVGLGQNDCVSLEVADVQLQIPGFGGVSAAYTHPSSAKATALPSALGAAASFDPAIAGMYGEVIAAEMHNLGLHVFEAPGVNLARLPILGRNFEYFGEDPYLSGVMAVAETRAIQSQAPPWRAKHCGRKMPKEPGS